MLKYDNFSSFIIFTEKLVMILKIGADFVIPIPHRKFIVLPSAKRIVQSSCMHHIFKTSL